MNYFSGWIQKLWMVVGLNDVDAVGFVFPHQILCNMEEEVFYEVTILPRGVLRFSEKSK